MAHKKVVYFASWSVYRKDEGKFAFENIDPSLFTHGIYAFVGINADASIKINDPWGDVDNGGFQKFVALKQRNGALKTMIAMGGWNEGSTTFSEVAASGELRQRFAANVLAFCQQWGFDGFDLDWEYPAQRGGGAEDRANATLLLQELRAAFDRAGGGLLISAAVAATNEKASQSYDTASFCQCLDFVNVMTYDFHGAFDGRTGHNAPMYPAADDQMPEYNIDASIRGWLSRGAPADKLVLGMAAYGRSFTVNDPNNHGINNPASPGEPGPLIGEAGMLGYNEINYLKRQGGWNEEFDDTQKVPFMYNGTQWVSFDNENSIQMKADYVKSMSLGGGMMWTIDSDDFRNGYPLLKVINASL